MDNCFACAENLQNRQPFQCFGEPGCTLLHCVIASLNSSFRPETSSGDAPRQPSQCEPPSREMKLEFSGDASMQDVYLLLSALSNAGFDVSVSVRATPASAPSPSGTRVPFTTSTEAGLFIESLLSWGAPGKSSKGTTRSSSRRAR